MVVCAAAAPAQDSGVLQGALLRVHDDILTLVAADQVHMHLMETSVPGAGTWDVTPAVPASLLVQAIQGIARTEDVRISTMTTLQQKRDGAVYNELPFLVLKMSSREIYITPTESYPDAFAIIPKEFAMHATCETSELRNALTKIKLHTSDSSTPVQLHFGQDALLLEVSGEGIEQPLHLSIPAQMSGEETTKMYRWDALYQLTKLNRDSSLTFECDASPLTTYRTKILLEKEPTFQAVIVSLPLKDGSETGNS